MRELTDLLTPPHVGALDVVRAAGFDSIQFYGHCDMRCNLCGHELVLLGHSGVHACNPAISYRRGRHANMPCTCVGSPHITSERGMCAWCNESAFPRTVFASPMDGAASARAVGTKCWVYDGKPRAARIQHHLHADARAAVVADFLETEEGRSHYS